MFSWNLRNFVKALAMEALRFSTQIFLKRRKIILLKISLKFKFRSFFLSFSRTFSRQLKFQLLSKAFALKSLPLPPPPPIHVIYASLRCHIFNNSNTANFEHSFIRILQSWFKAKALINRNPSRHAISKVAVSEMKSSSQITSKLTLPLESRSMELNT